MFRVRASVLTVVVLVVPSAGAQQDGASLRDSLAARSLAFFNSTGSPGLAVGVWKDGRVVFARGFGVARAGSRRAVTPRTVFHLASISKTFVAAAVMQLVETGRVSLESPVTAYLPAFRLKDARASVITVRQLLSHTAGMPDVSDYAWDAPEYDDGALTRWGESFEGHVRRHLLAPLGMAHSTY